MALAIRNVASLKDVSGDNRGKIDAEYMVSCSIPMHRGLAQSLGSVSVVHGR